MDTSLTPATLAEVIANVTADKSPGTATKYAERLRRFVGWRSTYAGPADKRMVAAYREHLAASGASASTVNGHLVAVRALVNEAADMGYIDPAAAQRMASVAGVKEKGQRMGNWLTKQQAQALLDAPDTATLKGKRDKALLAVLLFCGLRRQELSSLTVGHLQHREGHNVIADMLGKGGRVRSVKLPVGVKRLIDAWLAASGRTLTADSPVFVSLRKGGHGPGASLTAQAVYNVVKEYCDRLELPAVAAHDLRRTMAKLAHKGGAALEDISQTLGHASLVTTQRYLGLDLNLDNSAPDAIGLHVR